MYTLAGKLVVLLCSNAESINTSFIGSVLVIIRRPTHRRTGQHPFGDQTEFCPNGEHNLFVTWPRQGEKKELLQCPFVTVVDYTR